jgi:SPP1 gp7 family putative phage head morphogenesis protein
MTQKTVNELLLDALIRHQTYLLRYSGSLRNRMNGMLARTEDAIGMLIRDKLRNTVGLTSASNVRRMEALLSTITTLRTSTWTDSNTLLLDEMAELAYQEPIHISGILKTVAPVVVETVLPAPRLLRAIVTTQPFDGALLKDWAAGLQREDLRRIHGAIQIGMVAGEGSDAIARRVIGTNALNGTDGVLQMTRRQVEAITRTAVQHVASSARKEFMRENADIMKGEMFVATLDSRTTPVCRATDGKVFAVGKGFHPPLHIACRSVRVPFFDGEMLGDRPAKASTTKQLLREYTDANKLSRVTKRDDLPRGTKGDYDEWARKRVRELTGQVPRATNYQTWLKSQTNAFQDDILGPTRAKLFRDGNLTLDKFVAADGSELTLSQLASRHATAFRAAGIDPGGFI